MQGSKAKAAPDHEISLDEIRLLFRELKELGFVKRIREFQNGHPVYVPTAAGK